MRFSQIRSFTVFFGVLLFLSSIITTQASGISARAEKQDGCLWNIVIEVSDMQPGAEILLDLASSNTRDCNGNDTNPSWTNWSHGAADDQGRKTMVIQHGDYGRYTFTAHDNYGNQASTTLEYSYNGGNQPNPTDVPIIIHPTPQPDTGGNDDGGGSSLGGDNNSDGGNNGGGNNSDGGSPSPQATPRPSNSGCNSLSRLEVGDIASVSAATRDPVPLRTGSSTGHDIILLVAVREQVTIMGGPNCPENLVWWQVSYNGQPGWMAEINKFDNRNLIFVRGPEVEPENPNIVEFSIEGAQVAATSAVLAHSCIREIAAKAHYRSALGGFVLEIFSNPLPEEFEIYFIGVRVPDRGWAVQHNGFAGEGDGSIFLGISTRFSALSLGSSLIDNLWTVKSPC